jgi:outer membrane protein assembly factor BamB
MILREWQENRTGVRRKRKHKVFMAASAREQLGKYLEPATPARICVTLVLFSLFNLAAAKGDPGFRGNASHTGTYPQHTGEQNYAGLQWRFQTQGAVRSSPVLSNGVIYVGSSDGSLYAIDAGTGKQVWRFDAGTAISSTPAVADGLVFFQGFDNAVYAINSNSGALRWKVNIGPSIALPWGHESGDFWVSSPTIVGTTLLIGSADSCLYALEANSGKIIWKAKTGGRIRSSPAVEDSIAYVGSYDGLMYAFSLENGSRRWTFASAGSALKSGDFGYDRRSIQSSPSVSSGRVFFGARDGSIYAVNASTGNQLWRVTAGVNWYPSSPAVHDNVVFTGNSDSRFIQAIAAKSGTILWTLNAGINVFASPSVASGVVYTGDWNGVMHATDEASGKDLWTFHIDGERIYSSATIANGRLYFGSDDGAIYGLNLTAGRGLERAVYYDKKYEERAMLSAPRTMEAYFSKRSYRVLDADALATFLRERIVDRAPSVVVFAIDDLPLEVTGASGGLFKRYLLAGGKIVWVGVPPALWPYDPKQGGRDLKRLSRSNARDLLSVSFEGGNFDPLTIQPTDTGRRWGILESWRGPWAADPYSVTEILGADEQGLAGAWVRSYGGPEGSGFLEIPLALSSDGVSNLREIQTAAEYFPRQPR